MRDHSVRLLRDVCYQACFLGSPSSGRTEKYASSPNLSRTFVNGNGPPSDKPAVFLKHEYIPVQKCHCEAFFAVAIPRRNSRDCFVTINAPRKDDSDIFRQTLI